MMDMVGNVDRRWYMRHPTRPNTGRKKQLTEVIRCRFGKALEKQSDVTVYHVLANMICSTAVYDLVILLRPVIETPLKNAPHYNDQSRVLIDLRRGSTGGCHIVHYRSRR